jgi:RimJ/RimL family protein N-acetyltransferase
MNRASPQGAPGSLVSAPARYTRAEGSTTPTSTRAWEKSVELRDVTLADLALYERMRCDPRMTTHLGGPLPREGLSEKLGRDVESVRDGSAWVLTILPDGDATQGAGSVCIWQSSWGGEVINEAGWMVLPEFQGRGLATEAVARMLERARHEERWDVIHAFPATTNVASNAICRTLGFTQREGCDLEWAGRMLHCDHWLIDLRERGPRAIRREARRADL